MAAENVTRMAREGDAWRVFGNPGVATVAGGGPLTRVLRPQTRCRGY